MGLHSIVIASRYYLVTCMSTEYEAYLRDTRGILPNPPIPVVPSLTRPATQTHWYPRVYGYG